MELLTSLLGIVDLAAAAVFAVTGALVASWKQMDILGFLLLGVVTGVGGGTLLDLLLGLPVFWIENALPLVVCLLAATLVYFAAPMIQYRYRLLLWLDAVGTWRCSPWPAPTRRCRPMLRPSSRSSWASSRRRSVVVVRDILGQEPLILLRREIYVTAAALGAVLLVGLSAFGLPGGVAMATGFVATLALRGCALRLGWSLPTYLAWPGRPVDGE